MAVNSKQKGARFERALASLFRAQGYEARRTAQYCGNTGDASDVVGLPGIHVEAKHCEQMRLYEWMSQAIRDAEAGGGNALPAVFHKRNNAEILVTMRLVDWFNLYREWEAGHDLKEKEEMNPRTINDQGAINLIEAIAEQAVKDFMNTTPGSDSRKQIEREINSRHFESLTGLNGSELLNHLHEEYNKKMSARKGKRNDDQ